jgi:hypothetical protein
MQKAIPPYFDRQFRGPLIRSVFEKLFVFSDCLRSATPAQTLLERFGVADGPGFVRRCADVICSTGGVPEPDGRITDTVRRCVDDFFLAALGDDVNLLVNGNAKAVAETLDREMFRRLSGHFLGRVIWQVALRDLTPKERSEENELQIKNQSFALGDRIIAEAEQKYSVGAERRHRELLDMISENWEWFRQEMRR